MRNVIITGFMATGKTSVGTILARLLGMRFVDTDDLIEKIEGKPIREIFSAHGEEYFRKLEREICTYLATQSDAVIATGGGTLLDHANLEKLRSSGSIFCLHARPEVVEARITSVESRPLLDSNEKEKSMRRLLEHRAPQYAAMGTIVDASEASQMELAFRIAESLKIPHNELTICMGDQQYPVKIGRGVSLELGAFLAEKAPRASTFIAATKKVFDLFGAQLQHSLARKGISSQAILLHDGEQYKSLDEAERIIDLLLGKGVERSSVIVAVGGGVTGDLVGFVASILKRGVGLVHVPTTLLAQVDSSVGAKAAVNRNEIKNIIGTFYRPLAVFTDPCFLLTLGNADISNGMSEIIKAAVVGSEELFTRLENAPLESVRHEFLSEKLEFVEDITRRAIAVKAKIVSEDPFEADKRRILNFGHTFAHALESTHGLRNLAHGEAVALGMLAATTIAVKRGYAEPSFFERLRNVINKSNLPVRTRNSGLERILHAMSFDKKVSEGKLHFVLPEKIGRMRIVNDVTEKEVSDALREISEE